MDFARGVIRIEATEFFQPKSEDSAGDVEVDAEVLEILKGYQHSAKEPSSSTRATLPGRRDL